MDKTNNEKNNEISLFHLFWIFYICCFAGVVVETIWCIITNGFFESRTALILEPLNPVYGLGGVLLTLLYSKLHTKSNIFIFLSCMVIGGTFEYFCSLFQELIYGTISWQYYSDTFGILGRTSLVYSVFWGVLGISYIRLIYPFLFKQISRINTKTGKIFTFFLALFVCFDILFTSGAVLRREERREGIPANNVIRVFYDEYFHDDILKKIYPHMVPANPK